MCLLQNMTCIIIKIHLDEHTNNFDCTTYDKCLMCVFCLKIICIVRVVYIFYTTCVLCIYSIHGCAKEFVSISMHERKLILKKFNRIIYFRADVKDSSNTKYIVLHGCIFRKYISRCYVFCKLFT